MHTFAFETPRDESRKNIIRFHYLYYPAVVHMSGADQITTRRKSVYIDIDEEYTAQKLRESFAKHGYHLEHAAHGSTVIYAEYERIDWQSILKRSNNQVSLFDDPQILCSYCIRKGLIRKCQNAQLLKMYMAKRPQSEIKIPLTVLFELDCLEYLDEALNEAFEIRDGLQRNDTALKNSLIDDGEGNGAAANVPLEVFMMKPSLCNRASGLFVFRTMQEFETILARIYPDEDSDSESDDDEEDLSNIREWVIQEFIDRPLLINDRKFHIRTYCLAVGAMDVYVYDEMLALLALKPYQPLSNPKTEFDPMVHVSNTCIQTGHQDFVESDSVQLFWQLPSIDHDVKVHIFKQICRMMHDVFDAVVHAPTQFQPIQHAFELYGMDFLLDEDCNVYFLEANAYPDFKQTGHELSAVISNLFDATVQQIDNQFFPNVPGVDNLNDNDTELLPCQQMWKCYSTKSPDRLPFDDNAEGR